MNHMSNSDVKSTKMVYENPELVFVRFEKLGTYYNYNCVSSYVCFCLLDVKML